MLVEVFEGNEVKCRGFPVKNARNLVVAFFSRKVSGYTIDRHYMLALRLRATEVPHPVATVASYKGPDRGATSISVFAECDLDGSRRFLQQHS